MEKRSGRILRDFTVITLASVLYALAFNWFFQPNNLACGGFTGAAQIINHLLPVLPVGVMNLAMNIPLFVVGLRLIGTRLLFSSLYAMAATSVLMDVVASIHTFQPMDPLLACIYGGALMGLAIGVMMLVNATTGGIELLARLLRFKFRSMSIGRLCLICDVVVNCLYALVFRNINNALYGMAALYISSQVMDMVIYGSRTAQLAYVISARSGEVAAALLELNLGVTLLPATGGFSGEAKQVVLCAFKRSQAARIKERIHAVDPQAFLIVCPAHEVLGEGFGDYSQESL